MDWSSSSLNFITLGPYNILYNRPLTSYQPWQFSDSWLCEFHTALFTKVKDPISRAISIVLIVWHFLPLICSYHPAAVVCDNGYLDWGGTTYNVICKVFSLGIFCHWPCGNSGMQEATCTTGRIFWRFHASLYIHSFIYGMAAMLAMYNNLEHLGWALSIHNNYMST